MMNDPQASVHTENRTPLDLFRWLIMVPVSLLAGWLGHSLGSLFIFLKSPGYPEHIFQLMFLLPSGLAFTVAGAFVAPRHRIAVGFGLTALCMILSLGIHILMRSNPGLVNYLHFIGESVGAMLGAILIALYVWKLRKGFPPQHTR